MSTRFTGGDFLTQNDGIRYYFHRSIMKNELIGGTGAYQISNAGKAESGPSFGAIQYDIGGNLHGRELLEQVCKTVTNEHGERIISDIELSSIKSHLYKPFNRMSASDKEVYRVMKPQLDEALNSPKGREIVNADYVVALDQKVEHLNNVISSVSNPHNKALLQENPLAQLIVIDTENQYGPRVNTSLRQFLNTTSQDRDTIIPYNHKHVKVNGELGLEDIVRFKLNTAYAQSEDGTRDILRRVSNLVEAVGVQNVHLSNEDARFFSTGLRDFLVQNRACKLFCVNA